MIVQPARAFFLSLAIYFLLTSTLPAQDYIWPTEASRLMTSSFCEFRPRHYHAAVDIKTWRRNGYKIFAIADGYVYRLRVSANGYGKVIYLKLKDGNYAIYAHLDGFSKELEEMAERERFRRRENVLDLFLKPDQFPVKQGQHLGYTGDTGIGVPHLHFEMRNRHNQPINPLRFFPDSIVDTIAPRSKFLAVIPHSAQTLVNFEPDTLIVPLRERANEVLSASIYLTGPAHLALRSYDLADGNANRFDFYRAEMHINDSLIYSVKYDRFSYQETRLIELDKNFSLWRKGLRFYQEFYRHPANSLPFYGDSPRGAGLLSSTSLQPGLNEVVLKVYDYFGNEHRVEVPIFYHPVIPLSVDEWQADGEQIELLLKSPRPLQEARLTAHSPSGRLLRQVSRFTFTPDERVRSSYYYYRLRVRSQNAGLVYRFQAVDDRGLPVLPLYFDAVPPSSVEINPRGRRLFFAGSVRSLHQQNPPLGIHYQMGSAMDYRYAANAWMTGYDLKKSPEAAERLVQDVTTIIPGRANRLSSADGNFRAHFPADAVYDTIHVTISTASPTTTLPSNYRYLSPVYDVQPFDQPLNYGAIISYQMPDSIANLPGAGLYYWDFKKGWLYLPSDYQPVEKTFSARVTSLEKFTVIQDTLPPAITPLNLAAFESGQPVPRWLRFTIFDELAGIYKESQIEVAIDGRWMIFEYDPEEHRISIPAKFIQSGQQVVRIRARDNAGNLAEAGFTVTRR